MSLAFFLIAAGLFLTPSPSFGQSLATRLSWLRTQEIARVYFAENGLRIRLLELEPLGAKSDSIRNHILALWSVGEEAVDERRASFDIFQLKLISADEIGAFRSIFLQTDWAFLGNTSFLEIDTMQTRDIRARMEHHFGPPTRTMAEPERVWRNDNTESVQFEYWFLVNETMPMYVLDVNGPWDRGVVTAAPSIYRSELAVIKESLLGQLVRSSSRKPFADYYFNAQQEMWYVTGFDGASFFDVRIERPDVETGRPRVEDYGNRADHSP